MTKKSIPTRKKVQLTTLTSFEKKRSVFLLDKLSKSI